MKWRIVNVNGKGFKVQSRSSFLFIPMWSDWGTPYYPGIVDVTYHNTIEEARIYLRECQELEKQRNGKNDIVVEEYND